MMKNKNKEFNLSKEIEYGVALEEPVILISAFKEFIRILEERLSKTFNDRAMDDIKEIINELSGDKLI